MLQMIDLCAGTGAFSLAFTNTNKVDIVLANDIVKESKLAYDANFNEKLCLKDLHDIKNSEIPMHNILTAGFSCQPFSIAGKQKGFDDERSNIFWKILSIIESHNPECVILENVKNLTSHDKGKTFETIISNINNLGYTCKYKVLDTAKITNTPQHRERIYIVCFKNNTYANQFDFDFETKTPLNINTLICDKIDSKYYYSDAMKCWDLLKENITSEDTLYQFRRVYVRENKSKLCPTLTANMGTGGHNVPLIKDRKGIRKLTPRECFNFQGFPSSYVLPSIADSHLYKLAGNAVSVPVVSLIAEKVVQILLNQDYH